MKITKIAECAENLIQLQNCIEQNNSVDPSIEYLFGEELSSVGIDLSSDTKTILAKLSGIISSSLEALTKEQQEQIKKLYKEIESAIPYYQKSYKELMTLLTKVKKMTIPVAKKELNLDHPSIGIYRYNIVHYNAAIASINDILRAMNSGKYIVTSNHVKLIKYKQELEAAFDRSLTITFAKDTIIASRTINISASYIYSLKQHANLQARNLQYMKKIMSVDLEYSPKFFQKKSPTPGEVLTACFKVYAMTLRADKIRIEFEKNLLSNIKER